MGWVVDLPSHKFHIEESPDDDNLIPGTDITGKLHLNGLEYATRSTQAKTR